MYSASRSAVGVQGGDRSRVRSFGGAEPDARNVSHRYSVNYRNRRRSGALSVSLGGAPASTTTRGSNWLGSFDPQRSFEHQGRPARAEGRSSARSSPAVADDDRTSSGRPMRAAARSAAAWFSGVWRCASHSTRV